MTTTIPDMEWLWSDGAGGMVPGRLAKTAWVDGGHVTVDGRDVVLGDWFEEDGDYYVADWWGSEAERDAAAAAAVAPTGERPAPIDRARRVPRRMRHRGPSATALATPRQVSYAGRLIREVGTDWRDTEFGQYGPPPS